VRHPASSLLERALVGAMLETSLDAVIAMDDAGRVIEFNVAAERLFGYKRSDAAGRELVDLVIPEASRDAHRSGLQRVLGEGTSEFLGRRIQLTAVNAGGMEFPVELTVTRPAGSDVFVGFIRDLTEQRRAERRLGAQYEVAAALAESADLTEAATGVLKALGRALEWDLGCLWRVEGAEPKLRCVAIWRAETVSAPEFERVTRSARFGRGEGLPGVVWDAGDSLWIDNFSRDPVLPRAPIAAREGLRGAFAAPIVLGTEIVGVLEFFSREVREPDEDMLRMVSSVGRHVGLYLERAHAQLALGESAASYRQLFERHPSPMWLYDPDTMRFLAVNDAAVANYGFSRDEFLAMTIYDIRPREDVPATEAWLEDEGRGRIRAGVWRHRRKDGSLISVDITSDAVEFEGRTARIVLAQDVTEQRRVEEQLRQSQKMEAVGSLAGGIAHDFNNALMVIQLAKGQLERAAREPAQLESLALIDDACRRSTELTRRLLAFSRRQVVQPQLTSLDEIVEDTRRMLEHMIGEDIRLVCELGATEPIVTDPGQLSQVILNLSINARDAMPGGGTLTLTTSTLDLDQAYAEEHLDVTPGRYAVLQMHDTGVGMDSETRAHAFDPFFTTKEDGTGFGLATVYGIVKQSDGHIWLYSEPGAGTTFKLYFPIRSEEGHVAPAPEPETAGLEGTETILFVEDEDVLRPTVARVLELRGYTVITAANAQEALVRAWSRPEIDLLVTDVVMPGLNGRELAERLLQDNPTLRVIYTSGYPSDTVLRYGIEHGLVTFLQKPYLPDDLARKARALLDEEQ